MREVVVLKNITRNVFLSNTTYVSLQQFFEVLFVMRHSLCVICYASFHQSFEMLLVILSSFSTPLMRLSNSSFSSDAIHLVISSCLPSVHLRQLTQNFAKCQILNKKHLAAHLISHVHLISQPKHTSVSCLYHDANIWFCIKEN